MAKPKQPKLRAVPEQPDADHVDIEIPEDASPEDFKVIRVCDPSLINAGILANDVLVVYLTDDLQSGDLVSYRRSKWLLTRRYYPAPGGLIRLEAIEDDCKSDVYEPHEVKLLGRVYEVMRDGSVISTKLQLRPLDEKARREATAKHQSQTKRRTKPTRRIRVGIRWLEPYNINRGDKATVVMNGDVRIGELGYFRIVHSQQDYNQFAFACQQDSTCYDNYYGGERGTDSLCFRESLTGKCRGFHNGTAYGRVCAVERGEQSVKPSLTLRAYDAITDDAAGTPTFLGEKDRRAILSAPSPKLNDSKTNEQPDEATILLGDLRRQLARLDYEPSNEATRFQLETKIYKLEHATDDEEWPEFISA